MPDKLITIHNVEGKMLTSRVLYPAANVEYHSEKALTDAQKEFNIPTEQMTVSIQDNWDRYQLVS